MLVQTKKSRIGLLLSFEIALLWVVFYSFAGNTPKMIAVAIAMQPMALAAIFGDKLGIAISATASPLRKRFTIIFVAYILLFIIFALLVLWLSSVLYGVQWVTS
jgi:hypothetical protein